MTGSDEPLGVASTLLAFAAEHAASDANALADTLLPAVPTAPAPAAPSSEAPRLPDADANLLSGHPDADRYVWRRRLGQGGMGVVDWVWDADLLRDLAVKQLRRDLPPERPLIERFLWEARVTAYLDHPNIVPVHDLGLTRDRRLFFTMKRASGRTLAQVLGALRRGDPAAQMRFPLKRRLGALLQVCHAVAFAHERGVLHRDLKPANVMVGAHGEVLVMDWGLACASPSRAGDVLRRVYPGLAAASGPSGTPLYMSPEQAAGDDAVVDERSDVYALGVMLYELVSLRLPIDAEAGAPPLTVPEVLERVRAGRTVPLARVAPGVSRSIAAVVEKAMARDPADRYPTVADLRADLERVLDGLTPAAEKASPLRRFVRFYVHPDAGAARLGVFEIDLLVGGGTASGAAAVLFIIGRWGWGLALAALALAFAAYPVAHWHWWKES